jgi:hypothetical protein
LEKTPKLYLSEIEIFSRKRSESFFPQKRSETLFPEKTPELFLFEIETFFREKI